MQISAYVHSWGLVVAPAYWFSDLGTLGIYKYIRVTLTYATRLASLRCGLYGLSQVLCKQGGLVSQRTM